MMLMAGVRGPRGQIGVLRGISGKPRETGDHEFRERDEVTPIEPARSREGKAIGVVARPTTSIRAHPGRSSNSCPPGFGLPVGIVHAPGGPR